MTNLVLLWLAPLWWLGWTVLPASRRLFVNLPDGGLAAGRLLGLAVPTLVAFWFAAGHLIPLTFAPLWLAGLPLLTAFLNLRRPEQRGAFASWVRENRVGLLASDLVFLSSFAFFLWVRMRWPEINNLEKSMDSGLMASMAFTHYLPADSFWFSGQPFTDYYYFGHLMGGLLARSFHTPMAYAFNLVQPLFCALFIAPLWSLCAGLTGSARRGAVATFIVAMAGHFEPLRELYDVYQNTDAPHFWVTSDNLYHPWYPWNIGWLVQHVDWWKTSRVMPDTISGGNTTYTINEYPIFTLAIGDVHAHFFAFSLAVVFFCGCYTLFAPGKRPSSPWQLTRRRGVLIMLGIILGCMWMTSTWDLPTYGVLALLCAIWTIDENLSDFPEHGKRAKVIEAAWALMPFPLAWLVAWPYVHNYKPQVKGAHFELWMPDYRFLLVWGGFLLLWVICLEARTKTKAYRYGSPLVPVLLLLGHNYSDLVFVAGMLFLTLLSALNIISTNETDERTGLGPIKFETLLALCGFVALAAPMMFYIKGYFGEGYLHQDTVFKFTLQAWLLLGIASACGAVSLLCDGFGKRPVLRWLVGGAWTLAWIPPLLCTASVIYTRAVRDAPHTTEMGARLGGDTELSLDGAHYLSPSDWAAIQWLHARAVPGDSVLEAVGQDGYGHMAGEYDPNVGRVSALTGIPAPLGWPQHAMYWGADYGGQIAPRWDAVHRIYLWQDPANALTSLRDLGIRYVFVGDTERRYYPPRSLAQMENDLHVVFKQGDTFVAEMPK